MINRLDPKDKPKSKAKPYILDVVPILAGFLYLKISISLHEASTEQLDQSFANCSCKTQREATSGTLLYQDARSEGTQK